MSDTQLETLQEKGLVRLATVRPELEYLFRHALVQDAAYGSLLKQERRELHGQVGEALEDLYPERVGELAPVLAMHFEQAGETEKAIAYFASGGEHAIKQNAIREAFAAFDQAAHLIDLSPVDATLAPEEVARRRRRRIEIELGRAHSGFSFLPAGQAFESLEKIVVEADELGDLELISRVHMLIALGRLQSGASPQDPTVARSLTRLAEVGELLGDSSIMAMPLAFVGLSQVFAGPIREGVAALEQAVPLMQRRKDSIGTAFARGGLAVGYANLGEFDKADAVMVNAKELADEGDLIAQLDALIMESMVRSAEDRLDLAVPLARACVDRAEETGASACVLASSWVLGDALHRMGQFADARDVLKRGADVSLAVDRQVWRPTLQSWLRTSSAALGEVSVGGDWEEALATSRRIGNQVGEAGILAKRAEAEVTKGDVDAAETDFRASAALLESLGMRPALARVLLSLGQVLRGAARTADAEPVLQRSAGLFEDLGLIREAKVVRTILSLGEVKLAFS
jgi:tetratricopeptide (TPR) repeat protein